MGAVPPAAGRDGSSSPRRMEGSTASAYGSSPRPVTPATPGPPGPRGRPRSPAQERAEGGDTEDHGTRGSHLGSQGTVGGDHGRAGGVLRGPDHLGDDPVGGVRPPRGEGHGHPDVQATGDLVGVPPSVEDHHHAAGGPGGPGRWRLAGLIGTRRFLLTDEPAQLDHQPPASSTAVAPPPVGTRTDEVHPVHYPAHDTDWPIHGRAAAHGRDPTRPFIGMAPPQLPDAAYGAALASVPGIGPRRLRRLLDEAEPAAAWRAVLDGRHGDQHGSWRDQAHRIDVAAAWAAYRRLGIRVLVRGYDGYPAVLAGDTEAPAVLFASGDPAVLDRHPRVAVIGTRSATRYGLGIAGQLGADLAAAGVIVISGLALGIDGAAHEGAWAAWRSAPSGGAPPVGVVAGPVDVPYPAAHSRLWEQVADAGALLSESPIGDTVPRWRFPMRNRILAALSDVVVVVECHPRGGALHTVRAADRRGISVGAVPGSVRSPASAGTNDLLADGCFVVRDATDVLIAVGLARAGDVPSCSARRRTPPSPGDRPTAPAHALPAVAGGGGSDRAADTDSSVLDALGWEACSMEEVLRRTTLPLATASGALERLERAGRVRGTAGWWERC